MSTPILEELYDVILSRRGEDPKKSWTARLLIEAPHLPARKLGEETTEAIIAAMAGNRDELIGEAADVIYHLLVVLAAADITLDELWDELARRRQQSGIDEKASRDG
ncbi:MAG: phosphoribosyl-ATP diphosphatase [Alphaproteobacteria bacterium]|nr:phosphoribosyl-ATP diphosphatase [Alphaproteobacteria bacterium]